MKVATVSVKRNVCKELSDSPMTFYAWGALNVTVEGYSGTHLIHVTLSKAELVAALAKITQREDEIKQITNKGN